MPVHDWTRVNAGVYHDFHNAWISEIRKSLNEGILPTDYYALIEQHEGKYIPDILTLHAKTESPRRIKGGVALAEAPPKVRQKISLSAKSRFPRRSLAIRRAHGDELVALVELISPGNKDRNEHVQKLVNKFEDALSHGIHLLVIDLFPPGRHDSCGIHGALWDRLGDEPKDLPEAEPVTLASYVADTPVTAFLEHVAIGGELPEMPLFVDSEIYVNTPLEPTYLAAWRGTPQRWRDVLCRTTKEPATARRRKS